MVFVFLFYRPNVLNFIRRLWPEYVKERIHSTYAYFGGSVLITAASAAAIFRSPTMLNLAARGGWMPMIVSMALMIGSGMVARSIPYESGVGMKQLAWAAHCAIIGGVLAPLSFVGGPILLRAAMYTAGIVGGLSTVAVCAPSDKFLYMGGPLAIGLGVVFAASMASMFLPPTTVRHILFFVVYFVLRVIYFYVSFCCIFRHLALGSIRSHCMVD